MFFTRRPRTVLLKARSRGPQRLLSRSRDIDCVRRSPGRSNYRRENFQLNYLRQVSGCARAERAKEFIFSRIANMRGDLWASSRGAVVAQSRRVRHCENLAEMKF